MSALRSWASRGRTRSLAVLAGLALFTAVGFGAQPASADTAHGEGWHWVCAETLTVHDFQTGEVIDLLRQGYGDQFNIEHLVGNHASGYGWHNEDPSFTYPGPRGWVVNGYFC
jgi:hypothetical protein